MKNWLNNLMMGRYGNDELTRFLVFSSLIVAIVSRFLVKNVVIGTFLWYLAIILIVYSYIRMFSKNISKRYRENMKYKNIKNKILSKFNGIKNRIKQSKEYKFFKCSSCNTINRVPKGKGKIKITCPKCNNTYIKKT